MPEWLTYEVLKDFQTAIVGVFGFLGVISAQLLNGYLARKRDAEVLKRRKEAVTAAFDVEIKQFRDFFLRMDTEHLPDAGKLVMRPRLKRIVTPALISEIGLINTTSLEDVLYALLVIDASDSQAVLVASSETDTHLGFDADSWPIVANSGQEAAKSLQKALDAIEAPK